MRKLGKIFLLAGVLGALLCVGTLAAEADASGVYDVTTISSDYTLTPQTADSTPISAASVMINGVEKQFYANAERFALTGPSTDGNQYLVLALSGDSQTPTEDNIVYIDQTGATSTTVTFNVYPSVLTSGGTYNVYMVGTGADEAYKQVASFTYYAPYILGDVNEDKAIDVGDALAVLQYAAELTTLSDTQLLAADVNASNDVDVGDALMILQYAADLIESFK